MFQSGARPRAVVPACGIYQVTEPERFLRRWPHMSPFIYDRLTEVSQAYVGARPAAGSSALDLADPVVLLERGEAPARPLPPFFAFCGTADPLVADTQRLVRALRELGTRCEEEYYPGEPHAFHAMVFTRSARRSWERTFRFLERELGAARG